MGPGSRFRRRGNRPIRLGDDISLDHGHAIVGIAAGIARISGGAAVFAAIAAVPAGVISVAVTGIPAVGRVAVEVAPIALAAGRPTPGTVGKQGK